jgi:DNA-binding NarL/FixJ family response regulator
MQYSVLIVDDQRMSRQLFESIVSSDSRYKVIAAIETAMVADAWCAKGGVDLILMDVVMRDGSNGLDAAINAWLGAYAGYFGAAAPCTECSDNEKTVEE